MSGGTLYERFIFRPSGIPLVMSAVAVALASLFVVFADEIFEGDLIKFDTKYMMFFRTPGDSTQPIGPAWLQEAARDVTALGSFSCLGLLFLATLGFLILQRRRNLALLVTAAVLGGAALSTILKLGFDRPRPDIQHAARVFTSSFPSGHAMLSAITFLTLGALLTRIKSDLRLKVYFIGLAIFLTILVGVSRVYLGVHYPSDVLGGWLMGAAWALLCWSAALYLQRRGSSASPET